MNFEKFKDFFVRWKMRMQVAGSLFSMFGIPYLVASEAHDQMHNAGIAHPNFLVFLIFGFALLLTIGFLYDSWGFWGKENGYSFKRNEEWQKMRNGK